MGYYDPTELEASQRRDALSAFDEWNARAILATFAWLGFPRSYIDFGSGTGVMVKTARALGIDAVGVDIIAQAPDVKTDLRQPLHLHRTFAFATCIEVAEHLHEEHAGTLAASIVRHLEPEGFLVFTAAQPGQPGDYHVNTAGSKWWEALLYEHGLHAHREATLGLMLVWRLTTGGMHHLPANLTVYHHGGGRP